jgi:integrase
MLTAGVSLTIVAKLLGHSSEAITERHYGAWIKGRQEQLARVALRQAFPTKFAALTGRTENSETKKSSKSQQKRSKIVK